MTMYFAGIDIGSTMTKVVIVDNEENIVSCVMGPTGAEQRRLADKSMENSLDSGGLNLDQISHIVATGYGRFNVPFADQQLTELSCHAKGVSSLYPHVGTVIDIGGQDAKGFNVKDGALGDFVMNDKCAAGTGRFLEVMAKTLGLRVKDLGEMASKSAKKITLTNICTIFARLEVIAHLSEGVGIEDIVAGLLDSVSSRVARMVLRLKIQPDVILTGGVAKNIGVVKGIEEHLGCRVMVPSEPLLTGALGAALMGKKFTMDAMTGGKPTVKKQRRLQDATFFKE